MYVHISKSKLTFFPASIIANITTNYFTINNINLLFIIMITLPQPVAFESNRWQLLQHFVDALAN